MENGLPEVGQIIELSAMDSPNEKVLRFEVISVDTRTGLMEARACESNSDGEHVRIRMFLWRLQ